MSGARDRLLKLWELADGSLVRTFHGHEEAITSLAFSADGRRMVSGSYDETVIAWDVPAGRLVHTLRGHTNLVTTVAITPDGRRAVSGSLDGTVRLWNVENGAAVAVWEGHPDPVEAVAITPDGRCVVSAGINDSCLRLWDPWTGRPQGVIEGDFNSAASLVISSDGRLAVCALDDTWEHFIGVFDLEEGRLLRRLDGHADQITAISLSPGGFLAASASRDHTVRLWSTRRTEISRFSADGPLTSVAMTANQQRIITADESGRMHFLCPEGDCVPPGRSP
jgi:WD40 repeat protein